MSSHFPLLGSGGAERQQSAEGVGRHNVSLVIPRSLCRFLYVERPDALSRYQFEAACLLQARCQAPFVDPCHLILRDRRGAAIWWWDSAALGSETGSAARPACDGIPQSVAQKLPDGWYHLRLGDGFEARHVERGMVIGSAWRRQPFSQSDWHAFVSGEGGALIAPYAPPSIIDAESLPSLRRVRSGRVLVRAVSPQERLIITGALLASVLGGWWHGEAAGRARAAELANAEAARLEQVIGSYDLFVRARKEQGRLRSAQAAAGNGTGAIRFATVLRLAAQRKVQVNAFRLDQSELVLVARADGSSSSLRSLASQLEAMPYLSRVTASAGQRSGEMQLTARIDS